MVFTLGSMIDKMSTFENIVSQYGFKKVGIGFKPWSNVFKHSDGAYIDIRGPDWTLFANGEEVAFGSQPETLPEVLKSIYKDA